MKLDQESISCLDESRNSNNTEYKSTRRSAKLQLLEDASDYTEYMRLEFALDRLPEQTNSLLAVIEHGRRKIDRRESRAEEFVENYNVKPGNK